MKWIAAGTTRAVRTLAAACLLLVPAGSWAQGTGPRRPFAPGERLDYELRFGPLKVGTGSMEVRGLEDLRGQPAYHTVFRVQGGTSLYKVDETFES